MLRRDPAVSDPPGDPVLRHRYDVLAMKICSLTLLGANVPMTPCTSNFQRSGLVFHLLQWQKGITSNYTTKRGSVLLNSPKLH